MKAKVIVTAGYVVAGSGQTDGQMVIGQCEGGVALPVDILYSR
jgi:hypothetical protein